MSAEQMRKDFEKWYSDDGAWPDTVARTGSGYMYMGAEAAWRAWQAALATQPQAPQGAVTDAERYQWLRKSHPDDDVGIFVSKESVNGWGRTVAKILRNAELDRAIDKAIAAPKTETPEGKK